PGEPPEADETEKIEEAIQQALRSDSQMMLTALVYGTRVSDIEVSTGQEWATALLNPVDPETGQVVPAEPGLAVLKKVGGEWQAILPCNPEWVRALEAAPQDLVSPQARAYWLELDSQQQAALAVGPLGGYLLPWAGGQSLFMTQSVAHDRYTPSGNAHYAFDFAAPWDSSQSSPMFKLYAAKAGTVRWFVDKWPNHYYNPSNPNEVNYIVLEDTSTEPVTYQLYLHLAQDSIPPELKQSGAPVQQGQLIGIADDTGVSSGNHLHFHVHTAPNLYWSAAVDITFDDVDINGGRPRNAIDLPYCRNDSVYQDVCNATRSTYVSGNTVRGDVSAPRGDITQPAANGVQVETRNLQLQGWAADEDSGLYSAQFMALYNDAWHPIGGAFTSSPFSLNWDMCADSVPDGPVSLALSLKDRAGNISLTLPGLRHILKNYTCAPPPPACVPADNQVALFAEPGYQGACVLLGSGSHAGAADLAPMGSNQAASIQVGATVQATLYLNDDFSGRGETFLANDSNLDDNLIGAQRTSSVLVQARSATPGVPRLTWPEAGASLGSSDSLTLVWDDGGSSSQYEALLSPSGTTQSRSLAWQDPSYWSVGNLVAGNYSWKVRSTNGAGVSAWSESRSFSVTNQPLPSGTVHTAPYSDDMEQGYQDWAYSGNWDLTDAINHTSGGTASWTYEPEGTAGYDTGAPNSGHLTTPPIHIPGAGYYLRFWYQYETEGAGRHRDQRRVQISADGGPFTELLQLDDDPPNTWLKSPPSDLSAYAGQTVRVRFYFDTLDEAFNNYAGWFIDDFSISNTPAPDCTDADNDPQSATTIQYGQVLAGEICPNGDLDYLRFDGMGGDQIGISTAAGASLDPMLFLLDNDQSSVLAQNDDQIPYERRDSFIAYRLPEDGQYYIKLRAWNHPSGGDENATYQLKLVKDSNDPQIEILAPPGGTFLPRTPFTLTTSAQDSQSGIAHVQFYWHPGDWQSGDWTLFEDDWQAADGWSAQFDPATIADQRDLAFSARAFDWAGNQAYAAIWDLALDRTPPVSALQTLPETQTSNAIVLRWTAQDNLAGINRFEIQMQRDQGSWQDWATLDGEARHTYAIVEAGHEYAFRMRGVDRIGNHEAYPLLAETSTMVPDTLCGSADKWENDNLPATGSLANQSPTVQSHSFCNPASGSGWQSDEDWVKLPLKAGYLLVAMATPQTDSGAVSLALFDTTNQDATPLVQVEASELGEATRLIWRSQQDGVTYLRMRHLDGQAYGEGTQYTISISYGYPNHLPLAANNTRLAR
ncbi:MAG: peptidoglycan DD-metalloendopeptidase family protein, partial [Anaerolineales bacterium]